MGGNDENTTGIDILENSIFIYTSAEFSVTN